MRVSMSPRSFIRIVCAALAIVGGLALCADITEIYGLSPSGLRDVAHCGPAFYPKSIPPDTTEAGVCVQAIDDRRAWAWPLFISGLVGVAGAYLIRTEREVDRHTPEANDGAPPPASSAGVFQIGHRVEITAGPKRGDYGTIVPARIKLREGYLCVELASDSTRQYIRVSRLTPLDEAGTDEPTG